MSASAAAGMPTRAFMSIGEVLGQLRPEFPDITISKIRFLEAEGLIHPERTPSGYRKFSSGDVARLRFVLAEQRDHYLPLRVIKDHLDAIDRGLEPPERGPGSTTRRGPVSRSPRARRAVSAPSGIAGRRFLGMVLITDQESTGSRDGCQASRASSRAPRY